MGGRVDRRTIRERDGRGARALSAAGQRGSLRAPLAAFGGRLQAVAYRVLRDHELAEDATQQGSLRIWIECEIRDDAPGGLEAEFRAMVDSIRFE